MNKLLEWLRKLLGQGSSSDSSDQSGFTLVELLVIIGVLGILAVGLLATIDPLEQLRKGTDSNRKSAAVELVNAVTRYYATKQVFPWQTGGVANCTVNATAANLSSISSTCLAGLEAQGELKSTFDENTDIMQRLYIVAPNNTTFRVCYDPDSKAENQRAETKFEANLTATTCDPTNNTSCYWCAQ